MKQLSIICVVGLLFAVFVPFSLSFPSPDNSVETNEVIPSKADTPDVPAPTDTQSDAAANPDSEVPSLNAAPETTSNGSDALPNSESTPNQEVAPHGQGHEVGTRFEITCGELKCPPGSASCIVTKQTTDDLKFIKSNSTCLSENGDVLYSKDDQEPNNGNGRVYYTIANSVNGNVGNIGNFKMDKMFQDIWKSFSDRIDSMFPF